MRTIWKFPLAVEAFQKIDMPKGAEVLTVQPQGDQACIWAILNPKAATTPRGFWIYGTGHDIEPEMEKHLGRYVGTFQIRGYVWHVFEHDYE